MRYLNGEIELPQYQDTRHETIVKLTFDNEFVSEHVGVFNASVSVGLSKSNSHIIDCCNGIRDKCYGFKWMYKEDYMKYLNGEIEMPSFNDTRAKIIVKLTTDNKYVSEHEGVLNASISIGFSETKYNITRCCKGELKSAFGYKWMYKEDYMKYLNGEIQLPEYEDTRHETIVKLTFDNEFVSEHEDVLNASISIGFSETNYKISECCKGKVNSAFGYKWMYKKDYMKYLNGEIEMPRFIDTRPKKIVKLTTDNEYISEYEDVLSASISIGFSDEIIIFHIVVGENQSQHLDISGCIKKII